MQLTARLKNISVTWVANLRPRVNDVVTDGSVYYSNVTGYNDVLTNTAVWVPIGQVSPGAAAGVGTINKNASNYSGTDPFFTLSLSGLGVPAFPSTFTVYVDQAGTGAWVRMDPVAYDPVAQVLSGLDNPASFPSEQIKILFS